MSATPTSAAAGASPNKRSPQVLGLGVFLVAYGTNVSTPLLVSYKDRLDLGDSATMAIFTVYVVGILGVLPFVGQLSDRFGRRTITIPFVVASALGSLIMIFGRDNLGFLLAGRFFLGAASGAVLSVGAAWMQELLGPGREQRAAVVSTILSFAGFGLGPPISAVFDQLDASPLVGPFLLHTVATAIIVPLMAALPETASPRPTGTGAKPIRLQLGVPSNGKRFFRRVIAPASIWVFGFPSTSFALFPVIVSDAIDGSPIVVAAGSGVLTAWSALIARPVLPRIGPGRTLHLGMVSGTIGYTLGAISFATDIWQLVMPAAFLLGGASGLLTSGALAYLAEIADDESRGSINSTFYLLAYPGMTMPIILTMTARLIGMTNALVIATLIALTATIVLLSRRHEQPVR